MGLNYVRFDVGHFLHVCHRNTIEKYPNSSLTNYIKPEFDKRKSEADYIVIDRDGKYFGTILNFMRDERSLHLDTWTRYEITDLMAEADFYCLTELVEICDQRLADIDKQDRETRDHQEDFTVPKNQRFETVFGLAVMRELLESSRKRVIIMSYRSVRRFHIDMWLEELVKFCDFTRVNFYCLADRTNEPILSDKLPGYTSNDILLALYDPQKRDFIGVIAAPTDEKFRAKRHRYKTKLLTFCFCAQNDNFLAMMKS